MTHARTPAQRLDELGGRRDLAAALALFDDLPPVTVAEMMGSWRGSGVETGNPFDGLLESFGWRGKRFEGPDRAHPLVFEDARGTFSLDPAGLPLAALGRCSGMLHHGAVAAVTKNVLRLRRTREPKARLRMMEYRGVVSGTMSYDAQPVNDHFRAVDDDTLMGVMDLRGLDAPFVFLLRRGSSVGAR